MKKLLLIFFCLPILGLGQIKKINNTNSSTEIEIGRLADRLGVLGEMKLLKYNYHESKKVTYKVSFKNLKYMNLNQYSSFEEAPPSRVALQDKANHIWNFQH